jgi:hypothetical protein
MLSLPNSELYVWLRWSGKGKQIAEEIVNLIGFQPYEKTVYQGICDLRWEVKDFDSAVQLAENLRNYLDTPEVILIKATGKVAGEREILTLKDSRK